MGDVGTVESLWHTAMTGRTLEVRLETPAAQHLATGRDIFDLGLVVVTEANEGPARVLGEATTLADALDGREELREVGDAVECSWAGALDILARFLRSELRLAPPQGWVHGPSTSFGVSVNEDSIDDLDLQDMPWEEIASLGSSYGGFNLDIWSGWYRDRKTDMEDEYFWAGPDPDLRGDAWDHVLRPPMWPGGDELSVRLAHIEQPPHARAIERLVASEASEYDTSIELNGVVVWSTEPDS